MNRFRLRGVRGCIQVCAGLSLSALALGCGSSSTKANGKNTSTATEAKVEDPPTALHLNVGDFSTTDRTASVSGTTTSGAQVEVNSHAAHVHGTHWTRTVHLDIGSNSIEVETTMAGHTSTNHGITITRHHTQAELEAKAQARKERERREREHREVEEREEREHKEVEDATLSQQNALHSAESYLETSAFSEAGLVEQLSSSAGEGYPHADAVWAVDHLRVDWNEQPLSRPRLISKTHRFHARG